MKRSRALIALSVLILGVAATILIRQPDATGPISLVPLRPLPESHATNLNFLLISSGKFLSENAQCTVFFFPPKRPAANDKSGPDFLLSKDVTIGLPHMVDERYTISVSVPDFATHVHLQIVVEPQPGAVVQQLARRLTPVRFIVNQFYPPSSIRQLESSWLVKSKGAWVEMTGEQAMQVHN